MYGINIFITEYINEMWFKTQKNISKRIGKLFLLIITPGQINACDLPSHHIINEKHKLINESKTEFYLIKKNFFRMLKKKKKTMQIVEPLLGHKEKSSTRWRWHEFISSFDNYYTCKTVLQSSGHGWADQYK